MKSLWKEWTVGYKSDEPSVKSLNEQYGSTWRQDSKGEMNFKQVLTDILHLTRDVVGFCFTYIILERKYYSKRLVIIKEIRNIAEDRGIFPWMKLSTLSKTNVDLLMHAL